MLTCWELISLPDYLSLQLMRLGFILNIVFKPSLFKMGDCAHSTFSLELFSDAEAKQGFVWVKEREMN